MQCSHTPPVWAMVICHPAIARAYSACSRTLHGQHVCQPVVEGRKVLIMVLHGLPHDLRVLLRHKVQDCIVADGSVLGLTLGMHFQEHPVNLPALRREDSLVERAEAVQHPGLLVVCQVLDGQVVAQRIGSLLHGVAVCTTASHDVCAHLGPERLSGHGGHPLGNEALQGGMEQGGIEVREQLTVGLVLRLVVVHAILSSQGLDQVLQSHVPAHVITGAYGALDHEQAGGEGRVEGLQVEGELVEHRTQHLLPSVCWDLPEVIIEAAQCSH
mmetsp:Transcript_6405/g.17100  ORF Transcript_6405/g.17100 Transcript_6405/m.17100 type:complete len:271 (+) Transcript_6405:811-1623(+)